MNSTSAETMSNMNVLEVEAITKKYRGKTAVEGVSLSVPAASLTAILGPAGAGKTTTLRLIAGLESPDSGSIQLAGEDAIGLQPKDRDVAMIFDNIALYPNKTGFENIASPLVIRKEVEEEIEQRVSQVAAKLKISHILKRLPKTMSGGERQRIALGRALIRTPRLFLLDEPLSSLDAKLRIELRAELRRLQQELGYTFLLATPDFQEAMAIADNVIMLSEGKVVQVASPQQLYDAPVSRDVATFVGAPQINLLETRIKCSDAGDMLEFAGSKYQIPNHLQYLNEKGLALFEIGLRPENLALTEYQKATIKGRLTDIEPLGLKAVLTLQNDYAELRLVVKSSVASSLELGKDIGVSIVESSRMLAFDLETGMRL